MNPEPVHKRPYHAFLSHAHADIKVVQKLFRWLTEVAGLSVWLDSDQLRTGEAVATSLGRHLYQCRTLLLVLSKASVQSDWVTEEVNAAMHEMKEAPSFTIIGVRIEECSIPRSWGGLRALKWIEAPDGTLSAQSAWDLLASLHPATAQKQHLMDVFVSCGWRDREVSFTDAVCAKLARKGIRLIGDAPDQRTFREGDRVRQIMEGCNGYVAILPDRRGPSGAVVGDPYKYFLREMDLANELKLPRLIVCESRESLPEEIRDCSQEISRAELDESGDSWFNAAIDTLIENAVPPAIPQHAFFAAEYNFRHDRNRLAKMLIERLTAMPCCMGSDFTGEGLRQRIIAHLRSARMVISDLASDLDPETKAPRINLNTCIEAGIAIGAGVAHYLLSRAAGEGRKTDRLPFMFRDHQIHYYDADADLIGLVHKLALPHRRRVINQELSAC
jgi:hypothetical protein